MPAHLVVDFVTYWCHFSYIRQLLRSLALAIVPARLCSQGHVPQVQYHHLHRVADLKIPIIENPNRGERGMCWDVVLQSTLGFHCSQMESTCENLSWQDQEALLRF